MEKEEYLEDFRARLACRKGAEAQKEVIRDLRKLQCGVLNGMVRFSGGVAYWTTDDEPVPMECAVMLDFLGHEVVLEKQQDALDGLSSVLVEGYIRNLARRSWNQDNPEAGRGRKARWH